MSYTQTEQTVAVPLPKGKKNAVQTGCICIMLSVAMSGLALSTLGSSILESVGALRYVSLFSILGALGVTIMTPIGGKLGDLTGRRNIVIVSGIICAFAGIGIAFVHSILPLMILRLIVGLAQGTFTAAPYIIVGLINEKKDVPKVMGYLAAAIAIGGFGGSIIAGVLTDLGYLELAILVPVIPLIIGVVLIGMNLPNKKREEKVAIDVGGILALVAALVSILLSLYYAPTVGWTNPMVIAGVVLGILAIFVLIKVEEKAQEPVIPLQLFENKEYTTLLIISFLAYFYLAAMNTYIPIVATRVLGTSTGLAGSLQMPRTIICMLLPAAAGAWVGKAYENNWKAMAIATLFAAVPMAALGFTTATTSVFLIYFLLALTGISEGFRAVSITPAVQRTLQTEEIGIGTALVTFVTSLSGSISSSIYGVAYEINTVSDAANAENIRNGCNAVFLVAAAVSFLGFLIVFFIFRSQILKKKETEA